MASRHVVVRPGEADRRQRAEPVESLVLRGAACGGLGQEGGDVERDQSQARRRAPKGVTTRQRRNRRFEPIEEGGPLGVQRDHRHRRLGKAERGAAADEAIVARRLLAEDREGALAIRACRQIGIGDMVGRGRRARAGSRPRVEGGDTRRATCMHQDDQRACGFLHHRNGGSPRQQGTIVVDHRVEVPGRRQHAQAEDAGRLFEPGVAENGLGVAAAGAELDAGDHADRIR